MESRNKREGLLDMKKGDYVYTPRFCTCEIAEIYDDREAARRDGYTEPTHYKKDADYDVLGKNTSVNYMIFAAVKKIERHKSLFKG
jgi:hypothetical protein